MGEGEGWSLSLLYYDSEAESPSLAMPVTDPVTWEAQSFQERRQLGIQVHYTCVGAPQEYAPGEVELIVPDLGELFTGGRAGAEGTYTCTLAADKSAGEGSYDWYYEKREGAYHLYNKNTLEQYHNYEGSVQLSWSLLAAAGTNGETISLCASLMDVQSDPFILSFTSGEMSYGLTQTPEKLKSLEYLPAGDYIWVGYSCRGATLDGTRHLTCEDCYLEVFVPEGCILLGKDRQSLPRQSDGSYHVPVEDKVHVYDQMHVLEGFYYVGYEASIYGEQTLESEVKLYGPAYEIDALSGGSGEVLFRAQDCSRVSIADFVFIYEGDLYTLQKTANDAAVNSETLRTSYAQMEFALQGMCRYTRGTMRCQFIDDYMGILYSDGRFRLLSDEDYWIESISAPTFTNGVGLPLTGEDIRYRLYVRYKGQEEYALVQTATSGSGIEKRFSEGDGVVAWYLEVDNLKETLRFQDHAQILSTVHVTDPSATEQGSLYNFATMEVYVDGQRDLFVGLDSYANDVTRQVVAEEDISRYGRYVYRTVAKVDFAGLPNGPYMEHYCDDFANDAIEQRFSSAMEVTLGLKKYRRLSANSSFQGYDAYILLAPGMQMEEDFYVDTVGYVLCVLNERYAQLRSEGPESFEDNGEFEKLEEYEALEAEYIQFLEDHFSWEKEENWRGTGRVLLHLCLDYLDAPLDVSGLLSDYDWQNGTGIEDVRISFPVYVTYEDYLDWGNNYDSPGKVAEVGVNDMSLLDGNVDMSESETDENFYHLPNTQDVDGDGILQEIFGF